MTRYLMVLPRRLQLQTTSGHMALLLGTDPLTPDQRAEAFSQLCTRLLELIILHSPHVDLGKPSHTAWTSPHTPLAPSRNSFGASPRKLQHGHRGSGGQDVTDRMPDVAPIRYQDLTSVENQLRLVNLRQKTANAAAWGDHVVVGRKHVFLTRESYQMLEALRTAQLQV